MNVLNKLKKISVLTATLALFQTGNVSADPADDLKAALEKGSYTIRYENVTPQNQGDIKKEKTRLVQSGSMYALPELESDFDDPYMRYQVVTGLATSDGKNFYSEYSVERTEEEGEDTNFEYANCTLILGDECFKYKRTHNRKNQLEYIGNGGGKNKVKAELPYYNELGYPLINFGDYAVTGLLNVLIFDEKKPQDAVIFEKVGSGQNLDGLDYVDYKAKNPEEDTILSAIRYYFNKGQLVKIYAGTYTRKGDVISGNRLIINVKEFKTSAETNLLRLPDQIKDVTKRDKD